MVTGAWDGAGPPRRQPHGAHGKRLKDGGTGSRQGGEGGGGALSPRASPQGAALQGGPGGGGPECKNVLFSPVVL